MGKISNA
jgi:hypothetical protein